MKKISFITLIFGLLISFNSLAKEIPNEVKDLGTKLLELGKNPVLIAAVQEHNSFALSLDTIKERDAAWRKVSGLDDFMKAMMSSKAGTVLAEFEKTQSYYLELFLMDGQGANVSMTNKTSDYWQGDEAKWQKSFMGGVGAIHYGDVEFDDSSQAYLIQISVPVMDNGKAIGAITIGIDLDALGI